MENTPGEDEEMTKSQEIKFFAGLGAVAIGSVIEGLGVHETNTILELGGAVVTIGAGTLVLYQLPQSTRQFITKVTGVPLPRKKNT